MFRAGGIESEAGEAAELLRAYARTQSEPEAAELLHRLFDGYVTRWCREAARRTLRNYGAHGVDRGDEEADIAAEVMLQLTVRFQEVRARESPAIENLRAYTSAAVHNACVGRVRARCPKHAQLSNRIRYLLGNDGDFAAWTSSAGESMAGWRAWAGRDDAVEAVVPQRSGDSLKEVLGSLFALSGGPLTIADAVGAVAESLGLAEPGSDTADAELQASQAPAADRVLMERQALASLWQEVLELPSAQRAAVLLNLREIELIPATGTASFAELAQTLGLSEEALAALWPGLPLEDARIAEMLGLTRQQVINLRKSARERLARRRGNTGADSASSSKGGVLRGWFRRRKEA